METSLTAAEVMIPPQPDGEEEAAPPAASSSSCDQLDPMEEFRRRLEDIISTHGSTGVLLDGQVSQPDTRRRPAASGEQQLLSLFQSVTEAETENGKKEAKDDIPVAMETEVCLILKSLNQPASPEQKLEEVVRKCAELVALRRADDRKLCALQQRVSGLLDERRQLQEDGRSSAAARCKLEALCRDLQRHYELLREDALRRCREDEQKRTEITSHFQKMLTEIQTQIEQHSSRNDKLCLENSNLTDRLESLMSQCEMREESLEKINKRRDLQHKLTEAKLQQANAQLEEAEEKHKREKEYLLREAIEKTKKCFAMKEQELTMKKKLTLYAQKFDEFQATLAKSNEIYVRFKQEMDNMTEKMKKMEKESSLWKTRFENCNKALTDMIEERTEKNKEYDLFVLKIQKLEKLCQALQSERVVLYEKIKEVRYTNSDITSKVLSSSDGSDRDKTAVLTPVELQELQKEDLVLTEDMSRLREEQAKLQEIAASLLTITSDSDEAAGRDVDPEEDLVSSAIVQFKTKTQVKDEASSAPLDVKPETTLPKPETTPEDAKPEDKVPTQVETKESVKQDKETQLEPTEPGPTSESETVHISPPAELKPKAAETEIKAKPVVPVEDRKVPVDNNKVPVEDRKVPVEDRKVPVDDNKVPVDDNKVPVEDRKVPEEDRKVPVDDKKVPVDDKKVPVEDRKVPVEDRKVPEAPPSGNTSRTTAESSKKQTPKKKKKRNSKNAS